MGSAAAGYCYLVNNYGIGDMPLQGTYPAWYAVASVLQYSAVGGTAFASILGRNSVKYCHNLVADIHVYRIPGRNDPQIGEDRKKLAEKERKLTEQRIATMISQIQPHFIYNTLGSIFRICRGRFSHTRFGLSFETDYS